MPTSWAAGFSCVRGLVVKVCSEPGCPVLVESGRCKVHRQVVEARRGTRQQRGYDARHDRTRRRLLPAAVGQLCPLCGLVMLPDQGLDLDHSTPLVVDPLSRGNRIVHRECNARAGGRLSHGLPPQEDPPRPR